ncbi:imelysin family protein, partial [Staphylococcus aureus]
AKELHAKADTLDITPKLMLQGSVDILNEVATSKITDEEEIYSNTDLYDFKENVEGAQKIYDLFKPILEKKDKKLRDDIQMNFDKVNQLLDKYKDNNSGYASFEKVSKKDRKAFADAVNALGEPLSKMAVITA